MIGQTISHYKILEKIGEGGMGVVYKAEDLNLKRIVALKFLSPQAVGSEEDNLRFKHEAQAAAALDHSNICTIHEIDQSEDQTFIAMAYIDGQSLKEKIETKPLKFEESLNIAMQVAEGLHEAHEKGIVHRDIKSANIMVTPKGQAKIMDFGLAKQAGRTMVTKEGTTLGTISYMSPEQSQGASVDKQTDIWSFGVILYEMVTGQLPFKGDYEQAVIYSIINEDPEPITGLRSGVPMELERTVNKAMAKNPEERYQNVNDMLIDLRAIQRKLESITSKTGVSKSVRSRDDKTISPFKDLLQRRVPQILGIYLAASWAVIQFVDWLVNRYPISPNLPEFSLVMLASMVPTVLIMAYFHGKPGRDRWTRMEKFGIPANLVASALFLFILFHDKGLGSVTQTVFLDDEAGQMIERVIPKSEFRKKIALFYFDNITGDSTLNWLQYGMALALEYDIDQDNYIVVARERFHEKIKEAGFADFIGLPIMLKRKLAHDQHLDYFISGSFDKDDKNFLVRTSLYETKRGKLLKERIHSGRDVFSLIDEITVQLKQDLGIPDYHLENEKDLAKIESNLGHFENAQQQYQESLNISKTLRDSTAVYRSLSSLFLLRGQMEKAVENMHLAWSNYEKYVNPVQLSLNKMDSLDIYIKAGKQDLAFQTIEVMKGQLPPPLDKFLSFGYLDIYLELEDADSAEKSLTEVEACIESFQLEVLRSMVFYAEGKIHEIRDEYYLAIQSYKKKLELDPTDANINRLIGRCYRNLKEFKKAEEYIKKDLKIKPFNPNAHYEIALVYCDIGKKEKALEHLKIALKVWENADPDYLPTQKARKKLAEWEEFGSSK